MRLLLVTAVIATCCGFILAPATSSQPAPLLAQISSARGQIKAIETKKCLSHRQWSTPWYAIPQGGRQRALDLARDRLRVVLSAGWHHCLPTTPAGIIRYVFPEATEDEAISVADCESHLWPYARNPSGASGLFQLMPGHWSGRFNPFDPWANTRYAYRLSDAGYNWGAWVCKP